LQDASVQVRRYCKQDFLHHVNGTVNVKIHDGKLKLPGKPIASVTSVTALGEPENGLPDIPVLWWTFDKIDEIDIAPDNCAIINLADVWYEYGYLYTTFGVVYTFGPAEVPDDVIMVVANATLGVLTAPTMAAGLIGETIGPYSYRMERSGGGLKVALDNADLATLNDYRPKQATSQVTLR
jgi:hypothetical protein